MKRPWAPTGVQNFIREKLNLDAKEQIKLIIEKHFVEYDKKDKPSASDLDAFFGELDEGLSRFKTYANFRQKGLPATIKKNLRKARKTSRNLADRINYLDGNSRELLDETAENGFHGFMSRLSSVILDLNRALLLADEYTHKGGRLPEPHRIFLAADVADAIKTFLHAPAEQAVSGLYVSILEAVCAQAFVTKTDNGPDVSELARKALSYPVKIRTAGGLFEYLPPNDS